MTFTPELTGVDYAPGGGGNAYQVLSLFRGVAASVTAAPVLVYFPDAAGFSAAPSLPASIGPELPLAHRALLVGWHVIAASYTVTDGAVPGGGIFKTPDDGTAYAERDAAHVVQWIRDNAGLGFDVERIALWGVGDGSVAASWPALGPDLADGGAGTTQGQASSKAAALILERPVARWRSVSASESGRHFSATPSDTLGDIASGTLDAASPVTYAAGEVDAFPVHAQGDVASSGASTTAPFSDGTEAAGSFWHAAALLAFLTAESPTYAAIASRAVDLSDGIPSAGVQTERTFRWASGRLRLLPAEEVVLQAIEALLEGVTVANGFRTDVRKVLRWDEISADQLVFPYIVTTAIDASYDERQAATKEVNAPRIGLTLVLEGTQSATERTSYAIADVRKALAANLQLEGLVPEEPVGGLASYVRVPDSRRFVDDLDDTPRCGATLTVEVEFRNAAGDPYTVI